MILGRPAAAAASARALIAEGIGLARGGRIWLASELGRGITFTFALPVAA